MQVYINKSVLLNEIQIFFAAVLDKIIVVEDVHFCSTDLFLCRNLANYLDSSICCLLSTLDFGN